MAKKSPPADPQSCGSCRFFQANQTDEYGFCRRYPPIPISEEDGISTVSPITTTAEWCGEYQRRTH